MYSFMRQHQATLMHYVMPSGRRVSSAMDGIVHIRVTGFRPPCRNDELKHLRIKYQANQAAPRHQSKSNEINGL